MVKLDCEKFLLHFVAAVLTFFIAGFRWPISVVRPFICCASKHVDKLGAYSIPA